MNFLYINFCFLKSFCFLAYKIHHNIVYITPHRKVKIKYNDNYNKNYAKAQNPPLVGVTSGGCFLPDAIRTHDLQSRSLLLYPAELRADIFGISRTETFYHITFVL